VTRRGGISIPSDIDAVLRRAGFDRHDVKRELIWQIALYRRRTRGEGLREVRSTTD
jgi:hypothetical protein